jgi:diadenosine tetraphosphatase ApaH/serine/threonine PP2A family protein phosphatase
MGRRIVVGDIHGCYDELEALLERVQFTTDDRLIAVGDLVVKGNKNREVLDLFDSDSRLSSVMGNHDLALVRFWKGETEVFKKTHQKALRELEHERERYQAYLSGLHFMIDLGSHLVVHAGVRPGVPLGEQSPDDLTELRTLGADRTSRVGIPWYEVYDDDKVVLFGHWPSSAPRIAKRAIGLDTGCVYGGRLTAYIIESDQFVSVPAKRVYDSPKATPQTAPEE